MPIDIDEEQDIAENPGLRFGLALKRLLIKKSSERLNEPYLVTYYGSQASVRTEVPLMAVTHPLENVRRGEAVEFGGLGMLALSPLPVGSLAVWHVEVWESDQGHRALGETLAGAAREAGAATSLITALVGGQVALATEAITLLARGLGELLKRRGDDLLYTWAGSLYAAQLAGLAGSEITAGNAVAEVTFTFLADEDAS